MFTEGDREIMNLEWSATIANCTRSTKLFEKFDIETYDLECKKFHSLPPEDKAKYKGGDDFISKSGGSLPLPLNRNYMRLIDEVNARLKSSKLPERLPIDPLMQTDSIQDLLSSLENENYIKEIYKLKKVKVQNGLNTTEAINLMECIRQGRSLLLAGAHAEMLAKPLIDFYAACAYAYAIIVINSPLHKSISTLKGSHGHTYNHTSGTIDFGGEIPSGTFLDLLCALPVAQICNYNINLKYSLLPSIDLVQNNSIKLSLPALLSMVPELNDYYTQFDKEHTLIHKLSIDTGSVNASFTYNFYIGDGINRPQKEKIEAVFGTNRISENQGSYKVSVSSEQITSIMPCIYQDLKGQLWYVESPIDGLVLPELCLRFLIISALCNIMRYSPHEWSNILTNRISSQYSLLVSKYLRLFETKFPILVTEQITEFVPDLGGRYS